MNAITRDPLLAIAKGLLWFLMALMLISAVTCLIAIPLLHVFRGDILIALSNEVPTLATSSFLWLATGILAATVALVLIVFRIFQLLKSIVDTVAEGDPFVPINAARLTQMAWLTLGVQIATFVMGAAVQAFESMAVLPPEMHHEIQVDGGLSGNGLLLMLILFILARVFRKGAAMREELEGTV